MFLVLEKIKYIVLYIVLFLTLAVDVFVELPTWTRWFFNELINSRQDIVQQNDATMLLNIMCTVFVILSEAVGETLTGQFANKPTRIQSCYILVNSLNGTLGNCEIVLNREKTKLYLYIKLKRNPNH